MTLPALIVVIRLGLKERALSRRAALFHKWYTEVRTSTAMAILQFSRFGIMTFTAIWQK